ncbi:hypothetical protein ACY05_00980 [Sterolibacterium denitrificans]|uniref:TonB-dependent receptor n=1 Tax=Sterolibacterium denitrificans TaxID=157592 RepID=A0A656Z848_9PROT|nr:TonB-dependent receptor [Sterolibacterium denitrificans]KYC29174.1 hypothetical protein ACY05_00980 [Sterolibacterium denitrificans]
MLGCALGGAGTLQAAAETDTASPDGGKLEEITITAQKRREPLQQAPLAVSALGARELETQRVDSPMDLGNALPSLVMVPFSGNRAAPNMTIRGMGNLDSQITKDGANGIYIDGVPVGRMVGLAADIADLERVELLRGPQGTLYGRNTTGGAINFITARPEKDFSFEQGLTLGDFGAWASRTRVNLPLAENLYTRLAYVRSARDGWVENVNRSLPDQASFDEEDKEAVRWSTRLLAGERLTADLSLDHSKMTYGNVFFQKVAVPGRQESIAPVKGLSPSRVSVGGQQLTLTWQFDAAVLKSISAWRRMNNQVRQNYADVFTQAGDQHQDQSSQEFQLVGSALDRRIEYVVGLFFSRESGEEQVVSVFSPVLQDSWRIWAESKSAALYGQLAWRPPVLADRLRLTLGLRDSHDRRSASKHFIHSDFDPASNGTVVAGDKRFHKLTPTWSVDYAVSDDLNVYARLSNGYRAGGFNARTPYTAFGDGFDQENVRSREIGLKSEWFERRARLNLALFDGKYTDLQVDQVRTPSFFTDTLNAGRARVQGTELEATALLGYGLSASLYHTWLDARYDAYVDNGVDLAAVKRMPNAPKRQGGIGLAYAGERTAFGKPLVNLDYRWQSAFHSNPNLETRTSGYGIWNLRAQLSDIRLPQGRLRLALWGKNLTDREYRLTNTNLGVMTAMYGAPRTLGVDAIYEY